MLLFGMQAVHIITDYFDAEDDDDDGLEVGEMMDPPSNGYDFA
jgi:hypothetical protein